VGTFTYHDNLARAIQYEAKILLDLIPKIYDTERVVRIMGEDEAEEMVRINQTLPTGETVNDITLGKYDVTVDIGPSYSTKRQEAAEGMMQAINANPQLWNTMGDLLAKNLDWPGADEMAKRFKKMAPPGLIEDEDGEPSQAEQQAQQMQQMQAQMAQMQMQIEQAKAEAEVAKNQAMALKYSADAEKSRADMLQTLSEIPGDQGEGAMGVPVS
jgi:uncharacterized protein HemY